MIQGQDRDRAVLLSISAIAAMIMAYLLGLTVLGDTDMASKFENGVAPPGTDIGGLRTAAAGSIVAAGCAWTAMIAHRPEPVAAAGQCTEKCGIIDRHAGSGDLSADCRSRRAVRCGL